MEEHKTEIAYWAGRLIGYDQSWEVAEEIVEAIKEAQQQALILPVVGIEFTDKKTIDLEEKAFVAGYIKRAKMSNLLIDEITEFHAQRFYKNWQAFKHQP